MNKERCENCKWWVKSSYFESPEFKGYGIRGDCQRYPKAIKGKYSNEFCGEFKIKTQKKKNE